MKFRFNKYLIIKDSIIAGLIIVFGELLKLVFHKIEKPDEPFLFDFITFSIISIFVIFTVIFYLKKSIREIEIGSDSILIKKYFGSIQEIRKNTGFYLNINEHKKFVEYSLKYESYDSKEILPVIFTDKKLDVNDKEIFKANIKQFMEEKV